MKPVVLNKRQFADLPRGSVYVGRPSVWGNPFLVGRDGNRTAVIRKYETYITTRPLLLKRLHMLRGKNLVCWCAPLPCHADVLLRLANA